MDDRVSRHKYMHPALSRSNIGNFPLVLPVHKRFSFDINNFLMGFNVKYLYISIQFDKCQSSFILGCFFLFFMPLHKEFELEHAHHTKQVPVWKKIFGKVVKLVLGVISNVDLSKGLNGDIMDPLADDLLLSVSENIIVTAYILVKWIVLIKV